MNVSVKKICNTGGWRCDICGSFLSCEEYENNKSRRESLCAGCAPQKKLRQVKIYSKNYRKLPEYVRKKIQSYSKRSGRWDNRFRLKFKIGDFIKGCNNELVIIGADDNISAGGGPRSVNIKIYDTRHKITEFKRARHYFDVD